MNRIISRVDGWSRLMLRSEAAGEKLPYCVDGGRFKSSLKLSVQRFSCSLSLRGKKLSTFVFDWRI